MKDANAEMNYLGCMIFFTVVGIILGLIAWMGIISFS
jgi:hypothetical protein